MSSDPAAWPRPDLPFSFTVRGKAVSRQADERSRSRWVEAIKTAIEGRLSPDRWLLEESLSVTIYLFPQTTISGDIDNLAKVILDALVSTVYTDDGLVERLWVQKFGPDVTITLPTAPDPMLVEAVVSAEPVVYVRISQDFSLDA